MLHPIHTFIHRVGRLVFLDRAADPTAAGELQRNATHVKVYSGGAVRNLSDVHAQLHATAHQPGGGDAMAVDAAAATGSLRTLGAGATQAATGNHTHASSGAVTREGGQTTEATTTSTTAVDLLTAATLTIAAAEHFIIAGNLRKTTGAAAAFALGTKLNTTIGSEATATGGTQLARTGAADAANTGAFLGFIGSRVTSYLRVSAGIHSSMRSNGVGEGDGTTNPVGFNADSPTVQITDVVLRGIAGSALITGGADELHVYSLAAS